MRPTVRFLDDQLIERIIDEARQILCKLGITVYNDAVLTLLGDHGAAVETDRQHVLLTEDIIDKALERAPAAFKLYDVHGREAADLSGFNVNFVPGSAAIYFLEAGAVDSRPAKAADYVAYAKIVDQLDYIAAASTAMVPSDVHERISDSYRLYLSLMLGRKPVVTGVFSLEAFELMKNLQVAVRGSEEKLKKLPLTVFSACPTSPLKWSDITSQNLLDCARYGIPVEYIAMPLSGFIAPVTLVGTLIQHTAETLSGLAISQLAYPGAPVLYGGSPAVFDIRYETTPMGAIETMMIDCAYNEIGKKLGLPTQAYISLSDAKQVDFQAGLESSMGATLAALAGINSISGPGMLDFENCLSLEKLVADNEICGMVLRMIRGIEPKEDFPSRAIFEELLAEQHLLIADHTRKYLRQEHHFPGPVIERANRARWQEEGSRNFASRAESEVERLLGAWQPNGLTDDIRKEMSSLMEAEARRVGMERLPGIDL